jgi:hypothetical protein
MPTMTITEMKKDLAQMKRSLKSLVRAAGDDMGCDGTGAERDELVGGIRALEADIADAKFERARQKAMRGQVRRLSGAL